jgi:enoyl-CoA hydratase
MKMVLTGAPISAQEAFEAGLVTEICEEGKAVESAGELAAQIAGRAPLALQQAKSAINAAAEMPLTAALAYERQSFAALFATQDKKEGVDAFLEKRPPNWQSV